MAMHPSTKILITLGVLAGASYVGWRWWDYAQAKTFRERRLAREKKVA